MKRAVVFLVVATTLAACAYYVGDQYKYDPCVDKCQQVLGPKVTGVVAMRNDSGQCVCVGHVRKDMSQ